MTRCILRSRVVNGDYGCLAWPLWCAASAIAKMGGLKIFYIHGGGDTVGGIETYIAGSLRYHKLYEPYIGIVRYGRFFEYIKNMGFINLIDLKGGRLREIPKTLRSIYSAVRFIRNNDIRLLIAHGTHSWVFGGIISNICGVKSVFYVQGDIKKSDFGDLISGAGLRIKPTIYIANSEFTAKSVKQFLRGEVRVNHLASDIFEFDKIDELEARARLRAEFNIPEKRKVFSIIGRIQKWKGQDTTILAFKNMRHKDKACLMVVGDCTFKGDEPFYKHLKEISRNDDSIIFTGFRKDVPYIMKGSDGIIHASREAEPFGVVVVEGMMARKPVIATAHGGPLEIIENGKDGFLFNPEDYKGLAGIMDTLVEDECLRKRVSEEAYNKAKSKYTMEVSVARLEKIISDVIGI